MGDSELYDVLADKTVKIDNLLDGKGFIELVDVNPRLCEVGRTPEDMIVKSARISYAKDELEIRDIKQDQALLRYLYMHRHLSPFDMCNVTFHIKAPIFVVRQWMRHRTGNYNEMSLRYVTAAEEHSFYDPLQNPWGVRLQSTVNKQGSDQVPDDDPKVIAIKEKLQEANKLQEQIHRVYTELHEIGLAKEIARNYLPVGEYTHFVFQMNLRNLLNFIAQRDDVHAQAEIQAYASAIRQMITPLFPTVLSCFDEWRSSITFLPNELTILKQHLTNQVPDYSIIKSIRERKESQVKIEKFIYEIDLLNDMKGEDLSI